MAKILGFDPANETDRSVLQFMGLRAGNLPAHLESMEPIELIIEPGEKRCGAARNFDKAYPAFPAIEKPAWEVIPFEPEKK